MALADRASALAPDDPAVTALVHTVTEGGRASRRRKLLAIAGLGVVIAGGATAGVLAMTHREAPLDVAIAVAIVPDARAILEDAAPRIVEADIDAAPPIDAAVHPRADAARRIDAAVAVAVIADAAPPPDAAIVTLDAALAGGAIQIKNDTWCDVTIDKLPQGRNDRPYRVAAGHHVVACAQPGSDRAWTHEVDVAPNETATVDGVMLGSVDVTLAIDATIGTTAYHRGDVAHLKVGRYALSAGTTKKFFDLRVACTVRDRPELDCYP